MWLYKEGNAYLDRVGKWIEGGQSGIIGKILIAENSTSLNVKNTAAVSAYWFGGCCTSNKIDLTRYSKLYVDITVNSEVAVPTTLDISNNVYDNTGVSAITTGISKGKNTLVLDISNINTSYHIRVIIQQSYEIDINKVWLEK